MMCQKHKLHQMAAAVKTTEAKNGNPEEARAAIGRAEEYLATGHHSGQRHPLDFFFTYDQLHTELHVAYRDLVTAGNATPDSLLEHERLIGQASHMGRRAAMVNADAAIAHLVGGDLDEATKRADAAIAAAAPLKGGSGRVLGGLQRIRPHLVAYTPTSAAARDLDERLRTAAPWALAV
jgi:hypothetical protein